MLEFITKLFAKKRETPFTRSYRDSYRKNWIQKIV
jgi:hypothetical protein